MSDFRWVLVGLAGPVKGRDFVLVANEIRIGRTSENDIVVPGKSTSRHHASLFIDEGRFWVQDMNSKNGTFVNQRKVSKSDVSKGDVLRIGDARFKVARESLDPVLSNASEGLAKRLSPWIERARDPKNRRVVLYGGLVLLVAILYLAVPKGGSRRAPSKKTADALKTDDTGRSELPSLEATDQQVSDWTAQVDIVVQNEDYSSAVLLLKKIVSARPQDLKSKSKLAQVESRLRSRIALYEENGAREFEKLNYERAVMEWQMVLALSKGFDSEAYKRTQARIQEAQEKLRGRRP